MEESPGKDIPNMLEVVWSANSDGKTEPHFSIPISCNHTITQVSTITDDKGTIINESDSKTLVIERKSSSNNLGESDELFVVEESKEDKVLPDYEYKKSRIPKYNHMDLLEKKSKKKFIKSWLTKPEFAGWLEESPVPGVAYCSVCRKDLLPGKSELLKHAGGKKHLKKMEMSKIAANNEGVEQIILDLRSDTVTVPSREMRTAMRDAEVGDDGIDTDPTTKKLEEKVAELLQKDSGLFFPTGTMANITALLSHCYTNGSQVIMGNQSFLYRSLNNGLSPLKSINIKVIKNNPDGTLDLVELKHLLSTENVNCWPTTTVVCIENTHCYVGGRALPMEWLTDLWNLCESHDALVHCDGARLVNASVATALPPASLVYQCASSTFCLNKGLGAPSGSILVGSSDLINRASHVRKMLGGNLHQSGIIAAAGLYGLTHHMNRINKDHHNARVIAKAVSEINSCAVKVDLQTVQTNIVLLECDNIRVNPQQMCQRLNEVTKPEAKTLLNTIFIKAQPQHPNHVRIVLHCDILSNDINSIILKLNHVINEYENFFVIEYC